MQADENPLANYFGGRRISVRAGLTRGASAVHSACDSIRTHRIGTHTKPTDPSWTMRPMASALSSSARWRMRRRKVALNISATADPVFSSSLTCLRIEQQSRTRGRLGGLPQYTFSLQDYHEQDIDLPPPCTVASRPRPLEPLPRGHNSSNRSKTI